MTLADPLSDDRGGMAEFRGLEDELALLMAGIRRVQDGLRQASNAADERVRMLQSKVEELEADNLAHAHEITQLELENTELHRQLEATRPDLASAIAAQADAVKKLERTHRVIADMIRDREKPATGANTKTPTHNNDPLSRARNQSPTTVSAPVPIHGSTNESDDESTVRPRHSTVPPPTRKPESAGIKKVRAPSSRTSVGSTTRFATGSQARSSAAPKKRLSWYLEFANRPSSALLAHGPIPLNTLTTKLVPEDYAVVEIENLEHMTGYDSRIHVTDDDLAFVYRPVFLDGTSGPYLMGWGDELMVDNVKNWMRNAKEMHVFCYPAKEDSGWFYVGLQRFFYEAVDSVWHELHKEDKERLYAELKERNPDMDVRQFKKDVQAGKLVQCCIRLESMGKKVESYDFLREHGLLDADG